MIVDTSYKREQRLKTILSFFHVLFGFPQLTLAYSQADIVTHPVLIFAFIQVSTRRSPGAVMRLGP